MPSQDDFNKQVAALNAFFSEKVGKRVVESDLNTSHQDEETVHFYVKCEGEEAPVELAVPYAELRDHMTAQRVAASEKRPTAPVPEQSSRSFTLIEAPESLANARKILDAMREIDLSKDDAPESLQFALREIGFAMKVIYGPPMDVQGTWVTQFGVMNEDPTQVGSGVSLQFGALAGDYDRALAILQNALRAAQV